MSIEKYGDNYSVEEIWQVRGLREISGMYLLSPLRRQYCEQLAENRKFLFNFPIPDFARWNFPVGTEKSIDVSISYASREDFLKVILFVFHGEAYFKFCPAIIATRSDLSLPKYIIVKNKLRISMKLRGNAEYEECLDFFNGD